MKKYFYLIKRFLMQPCFYSMILIIFLICIGLKNFKTDSGQLFTIGLVLEEASDNTAEKFYQKLLTEKSNFKYAAYNHIEEAEKALYTGEINEIWVIPGNLHDELIALCKKEDIKNKIQVIVPEESVSHKLLKEVMFSKLMEFVAPVLCELYINNNFPNSKEDFLSQRDFEAFYKRNVPVVKLFEQVGLEEDAGILTKDKISPFKNEGLIFLPLRGILSVWLLVCVFAIAVYYIIDQEKGLFIWWHVRFKTLRTMSYFFFLSLIPLVLVLLAVYFCGIGTNFLREILSLLLYEAALIVFVNILCTVFSSLKSFGIVLCLTVFMSIIFTPVFIELKHTKIISSLLPGFYYLKGMNSFRYLLYEVLYIIIGAALWLFLEFLKNTDYRHKTLE